MSNIIIAAWNSVLNLIDYGLLFSTRQSAQPPPHAGLARKFRKPPPHLLPSRRRWWWSPPQVRWRRPVELLRHRAGIGPARRCRRTCPVIWIERFHPAGWGGRLLNRATASSSGGSVPAGTAGLCCKDSPRLRARRLRGELSRGGDRRTKQEDQRQKDAREVRGHWFDTFQAGCTKGAS
jgi:hypothetical protein